jgi:signal transduction histidine kinase
MVTRQKNRWHFNNAVLEVETSINDELNTFIGVLRGAAGLVATTPDLDSGKFQTFVNRLELDRFYRGVQGVGFAQKVPANEVAAVEQSKRSDGFPGFTIHPKTNDVMFPVIYLQPLDPRNEQAIGFDMFSEPIRRTAMMYAATNSPAVSGKVTLVQEIYENKQPGFLLYVPVFRPGNIPGTPTEREAALRGFVYSPFRAGDFFSSIFRAERGSRLHFRIYDGLATNEEALLFDSTNSASTRPWITTNLVVQVPGRQWTITFATTPEFEYILGGNTAVFVPTAGVIASFVIFALTFYFVRQHEELLRRGQERDKAQRQIESLNRELEDRVEQRTAELQETNSQLESFIYSVAHDLRSPLRSIRGFAEILEEDYGVQLGDGGRKHIERIVQAAGDMDGLIKDLLEYSQVSRGKLALTPVDINRLLSEVRMQFEPEIQQKNAKLSIDPSLPDVLGYEPTLRQALVNLLSNAFKFVPPNEKPDVRVYSCAAAEGHVRICVEDKGVGIDPEHHERIFGVFEQLSPDEYSGTGIGLAIVRRAVERMGGRVGVDSKLGHGSRFYIELREA